MRLNEIKDEKLEQRQVIAKFLKLNDVDDTEWQIGSNGEVNFLGIKRIEFFNDESLVNGTIPFKIGWLHGGLLSVNLNGLNSFDGWFPRVCTMVNASGSELYNFEGLDGTQKCSRYILNDCQFEDLHNIHKHITECELLRMGGVAGNPLKRNILGVLKIKGLKEFNNSPDYAQKMIRAIYLDNGHLVDKVTGEVYKPEDVACWVVSAYVGKGNEGIIAAQRKLLELDLDDFANF